MRKFWFVYVFMMFLVLHNTEAQDMLNLNNGVSYKVVIIERTPSVIRYKLNDTDERIHMIHLSGIQSIVYANGTRENNRIGEGAYSYTANTNRSGSQTSSARQSRESESQTSSSRRSRETNSGIQLGEPTLLQRELNKLPAIPILGNNLKFEFGGDVWIAKVNGRNFLAGSISIEEINGGYAITLSQTHVYPPRNIPGISWIRTPGPEISLEYTINPPSLRLRN